MSPKHDAKGWLPRLADEMVRINDDPAASFEDQLQFLRWQIEKFSQDADKIVLETKAVTSEMEILARGPLYLMLAEQVVAQLERQVAR